MDEKVRVPLADKAVKHHLRACVRTFNGVDGKVNRNDRLTAVTYLEVFWCMLKTYYITEDRRLQKWVPDILGYVTAA